MAAAKTFSRINAGKSMLFLGRFIRCVQHPRTKGAPTIAGNSQMSESSEWNVRLQRNERGVWPSITYG